MKIYQNLKDSKKLSLIFLNSYMITFRKYLLREGEGGMNQADVEAARQLLHNIEMSLGNLSFENVDKLMQAVKTNAIINNFATEAVQKLNNAWKNAKDWMVQVRYGRKDFQQYVDNAIFFMRRQLSDIAHQIRQKSKFF